MARKATGAFLVPPHIVVLSSERIGSDPCLGFPPLLLPKLAHSSVPQQADPNARCACIILSRWT
jgi:hypothetical protein